MDSFPPNQSRTDDRVNKFPKLNGLETLWVSIGFASYPVACSYLVSHEKFRLRGLYLVAFDHHLWVGSTSRSLDGQRSEQS